jgi:O-antigen ligase/polysaccharide polymerase Wzy-like membrane protein
LTSVGLPAIPAPRPGPTRRRRLVLSLTAAGVLAGWMAGQLAATGQALNVLGIAILLLPVALWRRPQITPLVLIAAALLVEQVGQGVASTGVDEPGAGDVVLTAHIPITSSIPLFRGIGSLHMQPVDLLVAGAFVLYLVKSLDWGPRWHPRSHVSRAIGALLCIVVLGIGVGVAGHGDMRVAFMEARPFVYLASAYFLTAVLIRSKAALRAALWMLVLVIGLKALQGLFIFVQIRHLSPRPEAVLGHEEAYTFALFIILVAALRLFEVKGRLVRVATWMLPIVIAADLANNRRAAWLLLGGALVTLAAVGYRSVPSRRRVLGRTMLAALAICAVYLPAYWNKTGGLAQPARALHSMVAPDPRDASSDLYREQENANLEYNIGQAGLVGRGFGVPIDYALPIVDISGIDPLITYVPHNGVLYILMRMGLLGAVAMWALIGAGIIAGCRLARSADREIAAVGALLAGLLVAYALEGATDQGFFFYRIAIVTGGLLGLAEAGRRLARHGDARPAPGAPAGVDA